MRYLFFLLTIVLSLFDFQVQAQCSVNAGNDTTICQGSNFIRSAITTSNAPQFQWYLQGNSSNILSSTSSINIPLLSAGTFYYIIKLTITSGGNCTDYDTVKVTVNPSPNIIIPSNLTACQEATQNITAIYSPNNGVINWYALGSSTSLQTGATFIVPTSTAGNFDYVVKIDSISICSKLDTVRVVVNPKPVANFTFTTNCGRKYAFTSTSNAGVGASITNYQWTFSGTGGNSYSNTSNQQNPNNTFPRNSSGQTFNIRLIVTNSFGCKDTVTQNIILGTSPFAELGSDQQTTEINGDQYFFACTSGDSTFTFYNNSQNYSSGTTYTINWGDGTSNNYNQTTFPAPFLAPVQHNYLTGIYNLSFIMNNGGCIDSVRYKIYVGNIPAGGIVGLAGSTLCAGNSKGVVISGTVSNTAGTIYTLTYNDGTPPVILTAPIPDPDTLYHRFDTTSCGTTSTTGANTFSNAFGSYLTIKSPCGLAAGSVVPIYVASAPIADFTYLPFDSICVGQTLIVNNTSKAGQNNVNGMCTPGKIVWQVTPNTPGARYTVTSGSLGTLVTTNPTNWTAGSDVLNIRFDSVGIYTIKIIAANNNYCGNDTMTKTICVNPLPTAVFNLNKDTICVGQFVNATGLTNLATCGINSFNWSVTYTATAGCEPSNSDFTFANGTNSNSKDPQFQFLSPGIYTINLQTFSPLARCSSSVVSKQLVVKGLPVVSISNLPASICQSQTISPTGNASCYLNGASTYLWSFTNGSPSSSNLLSPGNISFSNSGNQTVKLSVTNSCGTNEASATIVIKPIPTLNATSDIIKCAGENIPTINFTVSPSNASVSWTNSNTSIGLGTTSGTGNISSFTATNSGTTAISSTVIVTADYNGCSSKPDTFLVTVNPLPNVRVTPSDTSLCQGGSATLRATGADTYSWLPTTNITPSTGAVVVANPAGNASYTVTGAISSTGCKNSATANITVNPIPAITATSINPSNCATSTGSITINGLQANTIYILNYTTGSGAQGPINFTTGAGVTSYTISNLAAGSYSNITVTANGCKSNALNVSLSDPNPPNALIPLNNGPLCSGSTLNLTTTNNNSGTPTFTWTGPNGFTSNLEDPSISNVTVAASGVYSVTVTINSCTSPSGTTTVTILQTPATPTASSNTPVCSGNPLTLSANTTSIMPVTWSWTGPNSFTSTSQNPNVSSSATTLMGGTYTVTAAATYTTPAIVCPSSSASTVVVVNPTPVISSTSFLNPTECASATGSITLKGLQNNTDYSVTYTSALGVQNITIRSNSNGEVIITNLTAGTYSNIFVTLTNCVSNKVGPISLVDPNPPAAPTVSNDGPLCSDKTLNLNSTITETGTATYSWTGPNGFTSNLEDPSISNVTVAASGVYSVTVTINSCTSPAGTTTVSIQQTPATPTASSNTPVCSGNPLTLSANTTSTMPVTWSWAGPNRFTSTSQNPTVSSSATTLMGGTYTVTSTATYTTPALVCPSLSASTIVVVNPTPFISSTSFVNPRECASATGTITLKGLENDKDYLVTYTSASGVQNITIRSNSNGEVIITNLTAGTYSDIFVTLTNCVSNKVGPISLVDPNPPSAPTVTSNSPICTNEQITINVSSPITNGIYNWTGPNNFSQNVGIDVIINNAPIAAAGTYNVTVTLNNCVSLAQSIVVIVNPRPLPPTVTSPVIYCQQTSTVPLTANALPGHSLLWYNSATGGASSSSAPTPSSSSVGTVSYYVSQVNPENCEGERARIDVVVNPTPVVPDQNKTICSGDNFSITPSGSGIPVNTTYSWGVPVTTGGLTGMTSEVGQTSINGTLNNSSDFVQTATYKIEPKTGTCAGDSFQLIVTVNPAPRVIFSLDSQYLCSGDLSRQVTLTSPTPNATIPWVVNNIPSFVQGVVNQGNNLIPTQTIVNNSNSPVDIIYLATASINVGANCPGSPTPYVIRINPTPRMPDSDITICSGSDFTYNPVNNPPRTIVPFGTVYTWTVTSNSNISGASSQAVASSGIRQTLINSSNVPQDVIYTINPISGLADSCKGNVFRVVVTVNPAPFMPALFDTICSGQNFSVVPVDGVPTAATIVPAGTVYSWASPILPPGLTGASSGANQTDISGTLFNNTFAPTNVIYAVVPQSGASGNCSGQSFNVTITVNPLASISNNPLNQTICTDLNTLPVSWTSFTSGATYSWNLISTGAVTGFVPTGAGNTLPSMLLTNNSDSKDSVVYAVSSTANACSGPATNYVFYVNPDAKARFTFPIDTACWPFPIVIQNAGPASANVNYNWFAGSNILGTQQTFPGYTIVNPGDSIDIKQVALSLYGCKNDSITHRFFTKLKPAPSFTFAPHIGCSPLVVNFTNTTPYVDTFKYEWNFGNQTFSNLARPNPVTFLESQYFNDTTYFITLKAYNECDTMYFRDSVTVLTRPKARFGVSASSGCSPFNIQVTNYSVGLPDKFYWDFGNGVKDTTIVNGAFNYTYYVGTQVDTFPLMLIAENQCARDTQIIFIRVAPNTIRPNISINANDLFGCTPHQVDFINSSSGATSFTWDFGDGNVIVTNNYQFIVPHIYNTPGTYTVRIDMTNGCSDSVDFKQVTVYPKPQPSFTVSPLYCFGDTVKVINSSLNATNYRWEWGDGLSNTGAAPPHIYGIPGNYTITLRAERTSPSGLVCYDTTSRPVRILVKPDSTLSTNLGSPNCAPFTFIASAPGITNETITWIIFDTSISNSPIIYSGQTLQYIFRNPGTFTVKMLAENIAGCKDSTYRLVKVYGTPSAGFTPLNITTCSTDTLIQYLNRTVFNDNGPLNYKWQVDGVTLATSGNFSHRYFAQPSELLPKVFTTKLIATNVVGCSDTASGILQISPTAKAIFNIVNPNACVPFVPIVNNNSTYATSFRWYVNGVLVDTNRIPSFTISMPSFNYTIKLVAFNIYSCKPDTVSYSFVSRIKPRASFSVNDTLGCTGQLNIVTRNTTTNASSYLWDWGDATARSTFFSPTHLYNSLGQYRITLEASDGVCKDTVSKLVSVANKPVVNFTADNVLSCDTARVQFSNLTQNANEYKWYFSDGTTSLLFEPFKLFNPSNTLYSVKLVAMNSFGCKDSLTKSNLIKAIVPPDADFYINPASTISIPNYSFIFTNLTLNSNLYRYSWSLGDGSTDYSTRDVEHKYADTGSYPVRLIVLDTATNCPDTIIKIAKIIGYPGWLYVPNAFYPNSIQTQFRYFKPIGKGLAEYKFQVFDSWGKVLFESSRLDVSGSPVEGWDGTYKGRAMPQDAYAWRITAKFRNGQYWSGMSYNNNEKGAPGHTFGTVTLFR